MTAVLAGWAGPAASQVIPPQIDAGTIGRQNQRNARTLEDIDLDGQRGPVVTSPDRAPPGTISPGGPKFRLNRVDFPPSAFLAKDELDALAAPYLGRPIELGDIQRLINAINDVYTARGLVTASATLPPQKVTGGVLRIDLVEAKVGDVKVENGNNSADYIRRRITIGEGSVLDVPALSDQVTTFNRTGETQLRTVLQPGNQFGLTDLTLSATEPARHAFQVFGDNLGVKSVGSREAGGLYQSYGLLNLDDRLKLYGVRSEGNGAMNGSYTFGFNPWGGRLGVSYNRSDINIISGPFQTLDISGRSQGFAANVAQPIFGTTNWLVLVNAGEALSTSVTKQTGLRITDNRTDKWSVGLTVAYYGEKLSASVTPTFSRGHSTFLVTDRDTDFNVFSGFGSASLVLPYSFYALASGSWQFASQKLLAGDQLFQIGGFGSLRGYPASAVAGYSGYYGTFELHRPLTELVPGLDVFAFVDHGQVHATSPKETSLTSTGVGLSYSYDKRLTAEVTAGFPLTTLTTATKMQDYQVFARLILNVY